MVVVVVVEVVVTGGEVAGPVGAYFVKKSINFLILDFEKKFDDFFN